MSSRSHRKLPSPARTANIGGSDVAENVVSIAGRTSGVPRYRPRVRPVMPILECTKREIWRRWSCGKDGIADLAKIFDLRTSEIELVLFEMHHHSPTFGGPETKAA